MSGDNNPSEVKAHWVGTSLDRVLEEFAEHWPCTAQPRARLQRRGIIDIPFMGAVFNPMHDPIEKGPGLRTGGGIRLKCYPQGLAPLAS